MVTQIPEPYVTSIKLTVPAGSQSGQQAVNLQLSSGFKLAMYDISARIIASGGAGVAESELTCFVGGNPVPSTPFDIDLIDAKLDKTLTLTSPIVILWNKSFQINVNNLDGANALTLKLTFTGEIIKESAEIRK